ncbi:hypothetical protein S83_043575 [Arachis hypogaea]
MRNGVNMIDWWVCRVYSMRLLSCFAIHPSNLALLAKEGVVYMDGQFAEMRQRQDKQTEAINRQGEAIDLLYTNLGITNSRGIIPRPGP